VSIGDTLAEARRQAGLTITQVSQQTRIRESIVRAIEQGDFSPCGGDFYARGHIRSIAEVVGIDPVPLIREYDEEHPPGSMRASQIFEPATKNEAVIQLTAISDCWVGFNSPTGKSLYQGTVTAGQTMTWHEKHPVSMVIGNPPGVKLIVNGKPEQINTVNVVTLSINPSSKSPVKVG
jgi:cytoskeletal protein RodZ